MTIKREESGRGGRRGSRDDRNNASTNREMGGVGCRGKAKKQSPVKHK